MLSKSLRPTTSEPARSICSRKCAWLASVIRNVSPGMAVDISTSPLLYHSNRCSKPVSLGPAM